MIQNESFNFYSLCNALNGYCRFCVDKGIQQNLSYKLIKLSLIALNRLAFAVNSYDTDFIQNNLSDIHLISSVPSGTPIDDSCGDLPETPIVQ